MGNARNIAFWVVLFLLILALFNLFSGGNSTLQSRAVGFSDFVASVEGGSVASATLDGEQVRYKTTDGEWSLNDENNVITIKFMNPVSREEEGKQFVINELSEKYFTYEFVQNNTIKLVRLSSSED